MLFGTPSIFEHGRYSPFFLDAKRNKTSIFIEFFFLDIEQKFWRKLGRKCIKNREFDSLKI